MKPHPAILTPALLRAYRETGYTVAAEYPFELTLGEFSHVLPAFFFLQKATTAFLISAHNPFSRQLSEAENTTRNLRLEQCIESAGLRWFAAVGKGNAADWPAESGFFILDASRTQAVELLQAFEQNAGVWCAIDGVPKLLLHPGVRSVMTPPGDC